MAATVKNMECLRTASLALEQLSLNKSLSCRVHNAGREAHRVHRLSDASVTVLLPQTNGLRLQCIEDATTDQARTPVSKGMRQFPLQRLF
jgi:hypothetical protein